MHMRLPRIDKRPYLFIVWSVGWSVRHTNVRNAQNYQFWPPPFFPSPLIHSHIHFPSFVHSFSRSFICSIVHSFSCPFIQSIIHSSSWLFFQSVIIYSVGHSFIQLVVHSVIHSVVHSFIHSFGHSSIHSVIHSFGRSFIHSFGRPFIWSFIHSVIHFFHHSKHFCIYISIDKNMASSYTSQLSIKNRETHFGRSGDAKIDFKYDRQTYWLCVCVCVCVCYLA